MGRLRAVCGEEPRVAEAWVTGSRFTRDDGSPAERTAIAIVLDPPVSDTVEEMAATTEIVAKLDAAWPTTDGHAWLFVRRGLVAAQAEHCVALYARDPGSEPSG